MCGRISFSGSKDLFEVVTGEDGSVLKIKNLTRGNLVAPGTSTWHAIIEELSRTVES
jgi:hypothetical protein